MASYSYTESYESRPVLVGSSGSVELVSGGGYSSSASAGGYEVSYSSSASAGGATLSGAWGAGASRGDAASNIASDLLNLNVSVGSGAVSGGAVAAGGASAVLEGSLFSAVEQAILRASNPVEFANETETLTVNGQTGLWINRGEVLNWRGVIPITQYVINEDSNPEIIRKRTEQELVYQQEVAIRYLRPPTPPPPGEIIIRQEKNIATPPAPPLVIRQQPPRPETPAPLVVREAPPRPPASIGQKVITISGKRLPPAPRKVVIERLAPLPSKPQSLLIERWLPYSQHKRRVIFQKNDVPDPVIPRPRNVIIQWEAPQVQIRKEFKDLGVVRANPAEYVARYGASLRQHHELPEIVKEIQVPAGVVLAANYVAPSLLELEGDVQALNLIDLDREGLGEYRAWLARLGLGGASSVTVSSSSSASSGGVFQVSVGQILSAVIAELFSNVDLNSDSRISVSEAENVVVKLNQRLGRSYTREDAHAFFRRLDSNKDGFVDFREFRSALLAQFNAA